MAEQLKAQGNAAFSAGKFDEAVKHFSAAIQLDPSNHVLYSNRSGAYASLKKFDLALQDAIKTIELKPDWPKGYSRKGAAFHFLGNDVEARKAYLEGLKLDPNNEQMKKSLEEVEANLFQSARAANDPSKLFQNLFNGDIYSKLRAHPKVAGYLSDPSFVQKLMEIQKDPSKIGTHLTDPRILEAIGVLSGIPMQAEMPSEKDEDETEPPAKEPPKESPKEQKQQPKQETVVLTPAQQKAEEAKQKGNDAYKRRDFETAIKYYDEAREADPENIVYLTNKAAVLFEIGKLDECVALCNQAIDQAKFSDGILKAKAWARIGNAYMKQEKCEEAIRAFNKSLTENRTSDVLKQLQKAEKIKEELDRKAYLDPQKSLEAKERGNAHFKSGEYPEAIKEYTEAIKRNPEDPILFSNRAATYTKLTEYGLALKDVEEALRLKPDFVKAWSRKGTIYYFMKEYQKALEAYDEGLKLDPSNEEMETGIKNTLQAMNDLERKAQSGDKEAMEQALKDPEVQSILQDPIMMQIIQDMSKDPKAAQDHLRNPEVARKIRKLMAAGIIRTA